MWFFNLFKFLHLYKTNKKVIIYSYTNFLELIFAFKIQKTWKKFFYFNRYLITEQLLAITTTTHFVRLKYIGKIFRIKKRNRILFLALNYTKKHYVIYKNVLTKFKKKRKTFYMYLNTNSDIKTNLFRNLLRLRILNTYTKRGVYNNLYPYYQRKKNLKSHR